MLSKADTSLALMVGASTGRLPPLLLESADIVGCEHCTRNCVVVGSHQPQERRRVMLVPETVGWVRLVPSGPT